MKIALTWYEERNYAAARAIMDDARVLPETFARWREGAEKAERDLKRQGYAVVHAFIDPDNFRAWCQSHGLTSIDAARDDIGHGLDPSVRVLAENTAREPTFHQRQERVCGCEIPPQSPPASVA